MKRIAAFLVILSVFVAMPTWADTLEEQYDEAQILISEEKYAEAADILSGITGYQDASLLCMYARACEMAENGDYDNALLSFEALNGFRDSNLQIIYYDARRSEDSGMTDDALEKYRSIAAFRDCLSRIDILTPVPESTSEYWPSNIPEDQIHEIQWSLDPDDLRVEGQNDLSVLSVSPTGHYIAMADRITPDLTKTYAAGVPNQFGKLPDAIYLFFRDDDHYRLFKTIPIDKETQLELSSLLGGGSAFAWNEEEDRIVITEDWVTSRTFMSITHSNLYLLEIDDGTFQKLTQNDQEIQHNVLPQWTGEDTVCYVNITLSDGLLKNTLCEIDLKTGTETKLADLYSAEGRVCPVLSWQCSGQQVYYTTEIQSGFFKSPLGGSETDARCLIDVFEDLKETNRHPYLSYLTLSPQGISRDGKWACLNACDNRIPSLDIPFADDELNPQNDPAKAVSPRTGQPWIPCHDVFLYNLETEQLVNPFIDEALDPAKVIVTGACFSPDGKTLLCAVFGDGRPWAKDDMTRTTFYQIDLTNQHFTAVRVCETELESNLWFPNGFWWNVNNILCIPTGTPPLYHVQMIRPAVFMQY